MKGRVALFEWAAGFAAERQVALEAAGWQVDVESSDGERGGRNVIADPPAAVVFDLRHRASHSLQTAGWLRATRVGGQVPFVFVDGDEAVRSRAAGAVPGAVLTTSDGLLEALAAYAQPSES